MPLFPFTTASIGSLTRKHLPSLDAHGSDWHWKLLLRAEQKTLLNQRANCHKAVLL